MWRFVVQYYLPSLHRNLLQYSRWWQYSVLLQESGTRQQRNTSQNIVFCSAQTLKLAMMNIQQRQKWIIIYVIKVAYSWFPNVRNSSTSCYRCWQLQQRISYSWGTGWRWASPLLWSPRCSHTTEIWLTRARRTCSPSQRNRSRGLVSNCAEAIDGGNDGARSFSLCAFCCIPFQHFPVCVNQSRVLTASACYHMVTCTNICMNALARKLEGCAGNCAGVGIETAWQRCEGGQYMRLLLMIPLWHYELP